MSNFFSKILFPLTSTDYRQIFVILILTLFSTFLELVGIGLIVPILTIFVGDDYLRYTQYFFLFDDKSKEEILLLILVFFAIIYLIKFIFLSYLIVRQNYFSHTLFTNISRKLFKNYLFKDYLFHIKNNSSIIIRNITSECNLYSFGVIFPVMRLFTETVIFCSICIFLLWFNLKASIVAIFFFSLTALVFLTITNKKLQEWGNKRQYHSAHVLKQLQQSLGSIKEIIIYGAEKFFLKKYHFHNLENAIAGRRKDTITQMPRLILELVSVFTFTIVIIFLLRLNEDISEIFIVIGVFSFAAVRLLPSISKIMNSIQNVKYNHPVVDLIYKELLDFQNLNQDQKEAKINEKVEFTKIEFNNINFAYPNSKETTLNNVSLNINSGDKIGIVGKTGSGKTTLLNLICGLLKSDSGEIKIDNKKLTNISKLQKSIGYVPQSVYIADETILFNIVFGEDNESIDVERVKYLLKLVDMYDYVYGLPDNISTIVGERGGKLSGGQCQRIGIVRALYRDPSILILDEATSALDDATENLVLNSLFEKEKNRSIVIVSHKKNPLKFCNKIFEVKNKSIDEALN